MPPLLDLSGQKFGRLLVIRPTVNRVNGRVIFECQCDCGELAFATGSNLQNGRHRSCGCSKVERFYRHGLSRHPLASTWYGLVSRCSDQNHPQWSDYGGRGITVCPEWVGDKGLSQFITDMAPKPEGTTIDRIDNDGSYSAANCRWATSFEQQSNTRQNIHITYDGRTMIASEWARHLGIRIDTLFFRLKSGRPLSEVLTSMKPIPRVRKR